MIITKNKTIFKVSIILFLVFAFSCNTFAATYYNAKVKDISDRKYQDELYNRLQKAKKSIVVSMYLIKLYNKDQKQGPIDYLLNELSDAIDRGVKVTLYLNTKYRSDDSGELYNNPEFKALKEKGAKIYLVDSTRLHHDKLVIIDEKYILEGSHNWSVSALKESTESSTLIVSKQLAKEKLARLKGLSLEKFRLEKVKKLEYFKQRFIFPPDKDIILKKELLENKNLFPRMIENLSQADRAMDIYLLLLAYSQNYDKEKWGEEFPVFIDKLAEYLELPEDWTRTAKRRQIIKVLRQLETKYKLIEIDFIHGEEAWATLEDFPGETFKVPKTFFTPQTLIKTSAKEQFEALKNQEKQ